MQFTGSVRAITIWKGSAGKTTPSRRNSWVSSSDKPVPLSSIVQSRPLFVLDLYATNRHHPSQYDVPWAKGAKIGQLDKDCNTAVETIQTCFCMAQRFILPLKTLVKRKKTAKVQNCNQRSPVRYIDMSRLPPAEPATADPGTDCATARPHVTSTLSVSPGDFVWNF